MESHLDRKLVVSVSVGAGASSDGWIRHKAPHNVGILCGKIAVLWFAAHVAGNLCKPVSSQ